GHSARRHGAARRPPGGVSDRMLESRVGSAPHRVAREVHLEGVVQGVGFRPFVHGLATRLGLGRIVPQQTRRDLIDARGAGPAAPSSWGRWEGAGPPPAGLPRVGCPRPRGGGRGGLGSVPGGPEGGRTVAVSPDAATCADCLRELFDPADRRYRYPFINCTSC